MSREVKGRIRSPGVLLGVLLLAAAPGPAEAGDASAGLLLRRARYAIAEGRAAEATQALRDVRVKEPATRRGLEAALLLADVEFSRGDGKAADRVLAVAERDFTDGDAGAQLLLARGWLALARQDATAAQRHFDLVTARSGHRFTGELAQLGFAWARLVAHERPAQVPAELTGLLAGASDPALRVAAGLTLARAHAARGEHKQALRRLRALRRSVRGSSFGDDVDLAIGIAQLDMGAPAAARKTFAALGESTTVAAGTASVASGLTLADLRLSPQDFVARLGGLYAARADKGVGVLAFLVATLDRPAAADAAAARSLADAAVAARKEA